MHWDEMRNYTKHMQLIASPQWCQQCHLLSVLLSSACLLRDLFDYVWKYVLKSLVYWHQTQFSWLVIAWLETNAKRKICPFYSRVFKVILNIFSCGVCKYKEMEWWLICWKVTETAVWWGVGQSFEEDCHLTAGLFQLFLFHLISLIL